MNTLTMTARRAMPSPDGPLAPRRLDDTGLEPQFIADLALKQMVLGHGDNLIQLSKALKLPLAVTGEVAEFLRRLGLVELARRGDLDVDAEYRPTPSGTERARDALARCRYAGAAPVTIADYVARMNATRTQAGDVRAESVRAAFGDLVMDPDTVDQLGAAMNSHRSILLWGPSGSGKTFIAESLARLLRGHVDVPHALVVGNEVIQVFDPLIHHAVDRDAEQDDPRTDARWVRCHRPYVFAGGELTLAMLDLPQDDRSHLYQAPLHLKANGGMFVIDDLGRNHASVQSLLNRWIVPLENRRDTFSLSSGYRFTVPFDVHVVLTSNLDPEALADAAILRRIGTKVHIGEVSRVTYREIFERSCAELNVAFDETSFEWLVAERHHARGRPLMAGYPRDLVGRVRDFERYFGREPQLSIETLDRAWKAYFVN